MDYKVLACSHFVFLTSQHVLFQTLQSQIKIKWCAQTKKPEKDNSVNQKASAAAKHVCLELTKFILP